MIEEWRSAYGAGILVALAIGVGLGVLALFLLWGSAFFDIATPLDVNVVLSLFLVILGSLGLGGELFLAFMARDRGRGVDFFSPLVCFPLVFALFYGIGSLEFEGVGRPTPISQYALYFEGLLGYLVGVGTAGILATRMMNIKSAAFIQRWDSSRLLLVMFAFGFLSAVGLAYALTKTGLPILSGADVEVIRTQFLPTVGGYPTYFLRSIGIALVLLFLYSFSRDKPLWRSPYGLAFMAYALLVLPSQAARRVVFEPVLAIFIIYHYVRRRISLTWILLIGLVALTMLVAMGFFRQTGSVYLDVGGLFDRLVREVQRGDVALATVVEVFPSQEDFMGWSDLIRSFKTLLPGQQITTGELLKQILGLQYRGGGWVPTILGGLYMDFGNWGVSIGMFLCGLTLTLLYLWMRARKGEYSVTFYAYFSVFLLNSLRGKLLNEIWPMYVLAVVFLVNLYCRKRMGRNAEGQLIGEEIS